MNPYKVVTSGHSFFCNSSVQEMMENKVTRPETWREMIHILETNEYYQNLEDFKVRSWVYRANRAMQQFDIVSLGGDLKETNKYRVMREKVLIEGSLQECKDFMNGSHLRYIKEGNSCDCHSEWDQVADSIGNVSTTVSDLLQGCSIERKHYDAVDDIELWQLVE